MYIDRTNCSSISIYVISQQKQKCARVSVCVMIFSFNPMPHNQTRGRKRDRKSKERRNENDSFHISFYTWTLAAGVNRLPGEFEEGGTWVTGRVSVFYSSKGLCLRPRHSSNSTCPYNLAVEECVPVKRLFWPLYSEGKRWQYFTFEAAYLKHILSAVSTFHFSTVLYSFETSRFVCDV